MVAECIQKQCVVSGIGDPVLIQYPEMLDRTESETYYNKSRRNWTKTNLFFLATSFDGSWLSYTHAQSC